MNKFGRRSLIENLPFVMFLFLFAFLAIRNLAPIGAQHFVLLANSFLAGHLDFLESPGVWADTAPFDGKYYWPLGPFPAMLLTPFVAVFGSEVRQGVIQLALNILNGLLIFSLARKTGALRHGDAAWVALFYIFGSAYYGVAQVAWSWYFAHVVGTSAVVAALALHARGIRPFWVGLLVGLGGLTRPSIFLGGLYFVGVLWQSGDRERRFRSVGELLLGLLVCGGASLWYNYVRFQNPFEFGYAYQLLTYPALIAAREHGVLSVRHIPGNLYFFLLKGPEAVFRGDGSPVLVYPYLIANFWGMSLFLTSPIYVRCFMADYSRPPSAWALLTSLLMLCQMLLYYGVGLPQYGNRYALDFYPFLLVILLEEFRGGLTTGDRVLILLGVIAALALAPTILYQLR